mgnify:CR=1 FL=1
MLGEGASKKYFVVENNNEHEKDSSAQYDKDDEIFEERELKSIGPINKYIYRIEH